MSGPRDWSQIDDPIERVRVMLEVETGEPASKLDAELWLEREHERNPHPLVVEPELDDFRDRQLFHDLESSDLGSSDRFDLRWHWGGWTC